MENMDCSLEGFHKFVLISSKFGEGVGLLLENVHDRVDRIAIFELPSKRMVGQSHACLFLITLQGGIEEHLNPRAGSVGHYTGEDLEYRDRSICGMCKVRAAVSPKPALRRLPPRRTLLVMDYPLFSTLVLGCCHGSVWFGSAPV
jgi:hypothetical protein